MTLAAFAGQTRRMQLRTATRSGHQAVDDLIGSWSSVENYRFYLAGQRRFRAGVEALDIGASGLSWSFEPLEPALSADCADLGLTDPALSAPPDGLPLRQPHEPSEALGLCYVVEGAGLGARLLHARAAELGLDEGFAARHLAIQARSQRWRSFLDLIEDADAFDLGRAVASAEATFAFAARCFGPRHG